MQLNFFIFLLNIQNRRFETFFELQRLWARDYTTAVSNNLIDGVGTVLTATATPLNTISPQHENKIATANINDVQNNQNVNTWLLLPCLNQGN